MISELFMSRQNRDKRYRELKKRGLNVRRSSTRNQLLHPQYVRDYEQVTGKHLSSSDCGFGNTIYKTHFALLYVVEEPWNL